MKRLRSPLAFCLLSSVLLLAACQAVQPGADPVVVNAERDTRLAADTFDLLVHTEYDQRANLQSVDPKLAGSVKAGADYIRKNAQRWLQSARVVTQAYKYNRTAQNKANVQTALATLSTAVSQAQSYLNEVNAALNKSK